MPLDISEKRRSGECYQSIPKTKWTPDRRIAEMPGSHCLASLSKSELIAAPGINNPTNIRPCRLIKSDFLVTDKEILLDAVLIVAHFVALISERIAIVDWHDLNVTLVPRHDGSHFVHCWLTI